LGLVQALIVVTKEHELQARASRGRFELAC